VFKVAALRFDASVKASSSMLDFRVNHSLESPVKFVPCRHNALAQYSYKVKVAE